MRVPHLRRQIAALVAGGALVATAASPVWAHFGRPNQLVPAEVSFSPTKVSEDADEGLWQQALDPVSSHQIRQTDQGDEAETPDPTETPRPKHTEKPETHVIKTHVVSHAAEQNNQGDNEQADDNDQGERDSADQGDQGETDQADSNDEGDND